MKEEKDTHFMRELVDVSQEVLDTAKALGRLEETNRILREIDAANLPIGVWLLIRDIICPK